MRLIVLIFGLLILAGIVLYAKNSLTSQPASTEQTVRQQTKQLLDEAQQSIDQMQKTLEEQQRKMEEMDK